MKKGILLLTVLAAAFSCTREAAVPQTHQAKDITISAYIPETLTKVAAGDPASGKGVAWSWQEGDKITVIGDVTSVFDIQEGFQAHQATFKGKEVKADKYTLIYPGTCVSLAQAEGMSFAGQVQKGVAGKEHLRYFAVLKDVDEYGNFEFSPAWAAAHGGSLRYGGVLRVDMVLPASSSSVSSLEIKASQPVFHNANSGDATAVLNLSFSGATLPADKKLTAWLTTSWSDDVLPAGTSLQFTVTADDGTWTRSETLSSEKTILSGKVNTITLEGDAWNTEGRYAGGLGTAESPWLISRPAHLVCMAEDLADGETRYFKLIYDLDAIGLDWTPLNGTEPYTKSIVLDGGGHSITGLKAALFHDLSGEVKNLTLKPGSIAVSSMTGALANVIATSAATITDVTISGGSVKSDASTAGGAIGQIDAAGTVIKGLTVTSTVVGGTIAGGAIGFLNAADVEISGSSFSGGAVSSTARYCGGLFGSIGNQTGIVISDCFVSDATINGGADRVGGFVGQIGGVGVTVKDCTAGSAEKPLIVKGTINVGGFAGVNYGNILDSKAWSVLSSSVTSGEANLGGFVAYHRCVVSNCESSVTISNITGQNLGGFVGKLVENGRIEDCRASGKIEGATQSYIGGFAGYVARGSIQGCSTTVDITASNKNVGGFAGRIADADATITVSRCSAHGTVSSSNSQSGGFVGFVGQDAGNETKCIITISDCYCDGEVLSTNQISAGFIAVIKHENTVNVRNCYSTSNVKKANFRIGGLIGNAVCNTLHMDNCAAWNGVIVASARTNANWSSGAVVGTAHPNCFIKNTFRRPDMDITVNWIPGDYDHPDVEGTAHPLVIRSTTEPYTYTEATATSLGAPHQFPYHGHVAAGKTLSQLASTTLGWSADVWDFSADIPVLK